MQPLNTSRREVIFSGSFSGDEFEILSSGEHGFYTGDSVYYSAGLVKENYTDDSGNSATRFVKGTGLFSDGLYFIKRIDGSTVKFAKSRNDILNLNFLSVSSPVTVSNSKVEQYNFINKTLKSQKLLRQF